jgi:hypothetical protein
MKTFPAIAAAVFALVSPLAAQTGTSFTNFIRQVQIEPGVPEANWVEWDATGIAANGEALSPLAIDPGGARFELWTIKAGSPPLEYLLDSRYVGTYVPIAQVAIRSEDPYSTIPRTRADRPFHVDISITGLLSDPGAPDASKQVKLLHHLQSYGATGTGVGIDRTLATLNSQVFMNQNGLTTLTYTVNSLPGANRAKIRGEERFSVFSLDDYQAPSSQLASQFIQIWPVADGSIAGITNNQMVRFSLPALTLTVNDVYPGSHIFAQAYKGPPVLGMVGSVVPGSSKNFASFTTPQGYLETVSNYDAVFDDDGQWTIELISETPFGLERLDHVTFQLDRTIEMNGTVTTIDD